MSFNILDHLDKLQEYGQLREYGTWVLATCPVCGGKLKINTNPSKQGAYACYTNFCHESFGNPIRKLLYRRKPFSASENFTSSKTGRKQLAELVYPRPIDAPVDSFFSSIPFQAPRQVRSESSKLYTYFEYVDFRIVRLDYKNNNVLNKYIYPEFKLDNKWVEGVPTQFTTLPLYRQDYIQPSVVFTEGEKCATVSQKLGLAGLTFPTFAFSERYLDRYVHRLKELGVSNVLYLADNDKIGHKKAEMLLNYCYKHGIGGKEFNLVNLFPEYADFSGFDLYDAYKASLVTKDNVSNILEQCLCQ